MIQDAKATFEGDTVTDQTKERIAFAFGCVVSVTACVYLNWHSYLNAQCSIYDCYWTCGFPFALYEAGTWVGISRVLWLGLIADIVVALLVGLILARVFRYLWAVTRPTHS
jgi:hypothetical protein